MLRVEHDDQHAARIESQRGLPDTAAWMQQHPDRVEYLSGPPRLEAVMARPGPIPVPYEQRVTQLTRWLTLHPGWHTATQILNDLGVYGWRPRQAYCLVLRDVALAGRLQRRGERKRTEYAAPWC